MIQDSQSNGTVNQGPPDKRNNLPPVLATVIRIIDKVSLRSGFFISFLILPAIGSLVYEVIMRYYFTAPTVWAADISFILYGSYFMLGGAYALQRQQHIRTDMFYGKWSTRTKGIVDSILYITLFLPGMSFFLWASSRFAYRSVMLGERLTTSSWMPIIWPLKVVLPLSVLLLLLQGVSELIKSLYAARTGVSLHEETEQFET